VARGGKPNTTLGLEVGMEVGVAQPICPNVQYPFIASANHFRFERFSPSESTPWWRSYRYDSYFLTPRIPPDQSKRFCWSCISIDEMFSPQQADSPAGCNNPAHEITHYDPRTSFMVARCSITDDWKLQVSYLLLPPH
jgi:hypothetical protein